MIRQVPLVAAAPLTAGLHVTPTALQARVLLAGIHTLHSPRYGRLVKTEILYFAVDYFKEMAV